MSVIDSDCLQMLLSDENCLKDIMAYANHHRIFNESL